MKNTRNKRYVGETLRNWESDNMLQSTIHACREFMPS